MRHEVCLHTGSSISLIDLAYVKKHFPTSKREISSAIHIDGIGTNTTHGWIELTINLLGSTDNLVSVTAAFHIIRSLATPIPLGNDVLVPQEAIINISRGTAHFRCSKEDIKIQNKRPEVFIGDIHPATARTAQAFTVKPGYQGRVSIVLEGKPTSKLYYLDPVDFSQNIQVANVAVALLQRCTLRTS
jgi:hypothetical protein